MAKAIVGVTGRVQGRLSGTLGFAAFSKKVDHSLFSAGKKMHNGGS